MGRHRVVAESGSLGQMEEDVPGAVTQTRQR